MPPGQAGLGIDGGTPHAQLGASPEACRVHARRGRRRWFSLRGTHSPPVGTRAGRTEASALSQRRPASPVCFANSQLNWTPALGPSVSLWVPGYFFFTFFFYQTHRNSVKARSQTWGPVLPSTPAAVGYRSPRRGYDTGWDASRRPVTETKAETRHLGGCPKLRGT